MSLFILFLPKYFFSLSFLPFPFPPFLLFFPSFLSSRLVLRFPFSFWNYCNKMEESDGERAAGSDTAETEERAIRAMPIVTTLSYVRVVKDKARGVRVTLTCYNCREYGSCEKPQETPIHLSKERTTMRACL
jgi:hypothetical protein